MATLPAADKVAIKLGRSIAEVPDELWRAKPQARNYPERVQRQALRLYRQNVHPDVICRRLGVPYGRLQAWRREAGIPPQKPRHVGPSFDVAAMLADYKAGVPIPTIRRRYGIGDSTIQRQRKLNGIPPRRPGALGISPGKRRAMIRDYRRGLPVDDITRRHQVSTSTLYVWLRRARIPLRRARR